MKSIKIFATVGAIALLGTAGFTSCNQNNGPVGPGNYNGETVKTEFAITIPEAGNGNAAKSPDRRYMPQANTQTQTNPVFIGMEHIILIPFNTANAATPVAENTPHWGANIDNLADITNSEGSNPLTTTTNAEPAHYKVYNNIQVPLGTNHFLFYAQGTTGLTNSSEATDKFNKGFLNVSSLTGNPSTFYFELEKIKGNDTYTKGASLATYLSSIANTVYDPDGNVDDDEKPWSTYDDAHGGDNAIQQLYTTFIDLKAGSSNSVLAAVEDLYNTLEVYQTNKGTADPVVAAIMTNIVGSPAVVTVGGSSVGARELSWASTDYSGYPGDINLPDGAAAVSWNTTNKVFDVACSDAWHTANPTNPDQLPKGSNFYFPSCIYYYANSSIKTATTEMLTGAANVETNANKSWAEIVARYTGDANTSVTSNTRSVAIKDEIQYGVASVETTIKADADKLKDYRGADKTLSTVNAKMTAILIGGQQRVKFDFTPASATAGTQVIYDNSLEGESTPYILSTTSSTANPTLLLQTNVDQDVRVVVEFYNQGEDFYGVDDQLIPKKTHFYVVAQLAANDAASETGKRVFMQDHKTIINLNLKSLKNAYNVIPDLTTSGLEIGFSVNLTWVAGHTYNPNIE